MIGQIKRKIKLVPGVSATAFAELCLLLNSGYYSQGELQEKIGVCNATMTRYMLLLKRRKLIHIYTWVRTSRATTAYWSWGYETENAPKPARQTHSQSCKSYRARVKLKKQKEMYEST